MGKTLDIEKEINEILQDYGDSALRAVGEAASAIGKEAVSKLKSTSPKKTGKYAKGWAKQEEKDRLGMSVTVYNKEKPGLTHLLENGHAKRGGGRVQAAPHIKPVEEWAKEEFVREVENRL